MDRHYVKPVIARVSLHVQGIKQTDLAAEMGLHRSSVSRIVAGKVSIQDPGRRQKLAELLHVGEDVLFTSSKEEADDWSVERMLKLLSGQS